MHETDRQENTVQMNTEKEKKLSYLTDKKREREKIFLFHAMAHP